MLKFLKYFKNYFCKKGTDEVFSVNKFAKSFKNLLLCGFKYFVVKQVLGPPDVKGKGDLRNQKSKSGTNRGILVKTYFSKRNFFAFLRTSFKP